MQADVWQKYEVLFWVLTGIFVYLLILTIIYLVLKTAFHKKLGGIGLYLSYFFMFPLLLLGEITAYPRRRKMWLIRSGLKEGHSYLEEGIGLGTSPILASRIVGAKGRIYALDNHPLQIILLSLRSKIRRIKNIKLILSDASKTYLEDNSIDTIFICDAFHEFPDKRNTVMELYRVLKPEGSLTILEETVRNTNNTQKIIEYTKLFKLIERDKKFIRFKKNKFQNKE
ncbi:2-methoxy-6-polyprenyl-1,4-benzoquinol methylase [subsurface metagenome]